MNEVGCRTVAPAIETRNGRTLLTYADLHHPALLHGIAIFKRITFGSDYRTWFGVGQSHLIATLEPAPARVVIPHQTHSSRVIDADGEQPETPVGDAVVTGKALTAIGISISDCIPLFAVDLRSGVIGLAHCGWRGIVGGVVEEFIRGLDAAGAARAETRFLIGAAIGRCCYEVGSDFLEHFSPEEVRLHSRRDNGRVVFDLKGLVAARSVASGASPGNISIDKTCTSCRKYDLSSYRADGRDCGRMLAFMMLTG